MTYNVNSKLDQSQLDQLELEMSITLTPDQFDTAMARFYPQLSNNHPDVCLCYACAPGEYTIYTCSACGQYCSENETHVCSEKS